MAERERFRIDSELAVKEMLPSYTDDRKGLWGEYAGNFAGISFGPLVRAVLDGREVAGPLRGE